MLALTAERAGLEDGQDVLDLGWAGGSLALWTRSTIPTASAGHEQLAQQRRSSRSGVTSELGQSEVRTAEVSEFEPGRRFDRIVSVEMLEHVRNHGPLMERMRAG
jgi:cyclopropane-fatty-acyl-phospholipid synthase